MLVDMPRFERETNCPTFRSAPRRLFFIHLESRRVHGAGMTRAPNGDWMAQQAPNLSMYFAEQGDFKPTHIIRDRDTKFTEQFCAILEMMASSSSRSRRARRT